MAEGNILRWLEDSDSDSENHLSVPELPNEDCSDVEDVPIYHVIDGDCQSDSEVEGDEAEFQPIETETNTQPITNQAQPKISRLVFMKQLAEDLIKPHLEHRVHTFGLQRDLQFSIRRILKIE